MDLTRLLDDDVMGRVILYLGDKSYRTVAGTCRRFRVIYRKVHGTACTTSAEELVLTIAGAEFFCSAVEWEGFFFQIEKEESSVTGLYQYYERPFEYLRDAAALNGRLDVVQWAVAQGSPLNDPHTTAFATYGGHFHVLQWAKENGCPLDVRACLAGAQMGCLNILIWLQTNGCEDRGALMCSLAAQNGHLDVLQWASQICRWDEHTCRIAAGSGHLEILQWARGAGFPWDSATCSEAAASGHLNVLEWARANGCPWDSYTCRKAAANGHLNVLQWARANGCPWDSSTCREAAANGHAAVLEWALANGCPEN